jgi:hypothetical protein
MAAAAMQRWRQLGWQKGKKAIFAHVFLALFQLYQSLLLGLIIGAHSHQNAATGRWQAVMYIAVYILLNEKRNRDEVSWLGWMHLGPTHISLRTWLFSKLCWFSDDVVGELDVAQIIAALDRDVGVAKDAWRTHFEIARELLVIVLVPFTLLLPMLIKCVSVSSPRVPIAPNVVRICSNLAHRRIYLAARALSRLRHLCRGRASVCVCFDRADFGPWRRAVRAAAFRPRRARSLASSSAWRSCSP